MFTEQLQNYILYFAKVKPDAITPSKREEDAGYDVYPCFDEEELIILPGEIKMIPTGIASAFSSDYALIIKERGGTGTKGMSARCGVVDSGYRNEILVVINNTSNKVITITKNIEKSKEKAYKKELEFWSFVPEKTDKEYVGRVIQDQYIFYPYSKAIAQALLIPVPKVTTLEIPYEDLLKIESERMLGRLGSTNK